MPTKLLPNEPLLSMSVAFKPLPLLNIVGVTACRDKDGNWRNALDMPSEETHSHVPKRWQDRCVPLPEFISQLEERHKTKRDKIVLTKDLRIRPDFTVTGGYGFTEYGLKSLLSFTGVNMSFADFMITRGYNEEFADFVNNELDRRLTNIRGGDKMLVRMRKGDDGKDVIRAVLSQDYRKFDNVDFARALLAAMPEGGKDTLVSHAWSDDDDLNATFLLPDSIKNRPDSDYGIGVNGGNSEIGRRATTAHPELFRSVCWSGNTWGLERLECVLRKIHAGDCDLRDVHRQIERLLRIARAEGDLMLALMDNSKLVQVVNPRQTIAYLAKHRNLTQQQGQDWFAGYVDGLTEDDGDAKDRTVFGIYNGLTRAAQRYNGFDKMQLEGVASSVLSAGLESDLKEIESRWTIFSKSGAMLNEKVVQQYAGTLEVL